MSLGVLVSIVVPSLLGYALQMLYPISTLEVIYLVELLVCMMWYGWVSDLAPEHPIKKFIRSSEMAGSLHAEFCMSGWVSVPCVVVGVALPAFSWTIGTAVAVLGLTGVPAIICILNEIDEGDSDDFTPA